MSLRQKVLRRVKDVMASRPPDFEIGTPDDPYLQRWFVFPWGNYDRFAKPKNAWEAFKRRLPNVYLHRILRDDDDHALHCHPWASASWLLENSYTEVLFYPLHPDRIAQLRQQGVARPTYAAYRPEGSVTFRAGPSAHRLVLDKVAGRLGRTRGVPVISLFFVGFKYREWGFYCPKGWKPFYEFVKPSDRGNVAKGCE